MELYDAMVLARELMQEHKLIDHGFEFKWIKSKRVFGSVRARGTLRILNLSSKLVSLNEEKHVRDTILHEIAHALDFIRNGYKWRRHSKSGRGIGHDHVWRSICREIGASPERTCGGADGVIIPKKEYKWAVVHKVTNKVYVQYYRKPRICLTLAFMPGKENETIGQLKLVKLR